MSHLRLLLRILYWDFLREMRRRESLANMILFSVMVLFVAQFGLGTDKGVAASVGPVFFWIAVLFAGTVGLSQTFSSERDGGALVGVVTAPIELGVFYLAKVMATWLYVMIMEGFALGAYIVLFNYNAWSHLGQLLLVMGVFTLTYLAPGVVLAAMTSSLRGAGDVLLRILLFPMMLPMIGLTLSASQTVFSVSLANGAIGPPIQLKHYFAIGLAFDTIYLSAGFLLFPKVLEE